jgi:hypothetical protein
MMRNTEKPMDSQDARDEVFLLKHSSRPSTVSLAQVREQLVKRPEIARAESKGGRPHGPGLLVGIHRGA